MARIGFVLPVKGGGGGAHSVVQEVTAMRTLGADATIFVNEKNFESFRRTYRRFDWISDGCVVFGGPKELAERTEGYDIVIATTNTSAHSIAEATQLSKRPVPTGYYVQDYEPLFYEVGSEPWHLAVASFGILKTCTYFAKTRWLCNIVDTLHNHEVSRVTPSIDTSIYHPKRRAAGSRRLVCAMVRPSTPRRAPHRTIRTLARIASQFSDRIELVAFGCDAKELDAFGMTLPSEVELAGVLSQPEVAALLQRSDFFLDLSDYQAFGRTAAETMACGAIVLAPQIGGAGEFIEHGRNSFLVDTRDEAAVMLMVEQMLSMTEDEMRQMRLAALEAVAGFTPLAAALSEFRAFGLA
jgi:glycosyltransferase involved in cell wall biosynthesis